MRFSHKINMELLSPVGSFDNLIAAVQNGADAVYLGANMFNARANAQNFDRDELKEAIMYARKRGVDVHLTLNILMFNNELKDAIELAKFAYECGVSAIIVQDIGLAKELVNRFPDLPIHASTQMTINNINGVKTVEKLGLKRAVLARELSLKEISNIRKNTDMELECFGHGALCVSYSGQCLFSSIVGRRSGNRGLCAGPCRMNYKLLKDDKNIEEGYLLSTKDTCTLQILPQLIECGIDSIKIEGRKKSYEYVSIVTKIYRKYIDLAKDKTKEYKVEDEDMKQILQIYNRGGMGTGYFENRQNMVYPEKPNHLGIFIGTVKNVNFKKKQITINLKEEVKLGDIISINDETSYISEIVNGNTVGEIKGLKNIKNGDKIYRIVSKTLNKEQWDAYKKEVRKVDVNAKIYDDNENIYLEITNGKITTKVSQSKEVYEVGELDDSKIIAQIQKTGNTIFNISNIDIELNDKKLPVSRLNNLRRDALEKFEKDLENSILRKYDENIEIDLYEKKPRKNLVPKVNLYLQKIDDKIDYSKLDYNEIYIHFKDLIGRNDIRDCIVVLPTIIDEIYEKFIQKNIDVFEKAKAVAITHISQIELLKKLNINKEIVADYTLNITNNLSEKILEEANVKRFTMSPEIDKSSINSFSGNMEKELVVYGRICLMTSKYCAIGKNGNCYQACKNGEYILNDRKDFNFPIITDRINCHTKIYNSKILSMEYKNFDIDYVRIDVLTESEDEIKNIIDKVKNNEKLTGKEYTNGINN